MARVVKDKSNIITIRKAIDSSRVILAISKISDSTYVVCEYDAEIHTLGLVSLGDLLSGTINSETLIEYEGFSCVNATMSEYLDHLLEKYDLHAFDSVKDAIKFIDKRCGWSGME